MRKNDLLMVLLTLCLTANFASAELVANGDAEDATPFASWFHSAGTTEPVDNGPSLPGSKCFGVPTGNDMRCEYIPVTPGDVLTVTLDYKSTTGTTGQIYALLRYWDGGTWLGQNGEALAPTDGQWQTFTIENSLVPIGAATADIAFFTAGFSGEFRFDNIDLTFPITPYGVLVANGDAESEIEFQDWFHSAGTIEPADNGPSMAGVKCFGIPTGNDMRTINFPVKPGDTINVFFDYKSTTGTTGQIYALLRYWDGGTWLGQDGGTLDPTNDIWKVVSIENSIVPNGATSADITFFTNGFTGEYRFDNVMRATNADNSDNLVMNGGAESDFAYWYHAAQGVTIANESYGVGSKSFQIERIDYYDPDRDMRSVAYPAKPGDSLALKFNYKTTPLPSNTGRIEALVRFWGAGGAEGGDWKGQGYALMDNTDGTWVDSPTIIGIAPEDTQTFDVLFHCISTEFFEGTALIDNVLVINTKSYGDADGDGMIDPNDFTLVASQWLADGMDDSTLLPALIVDDFEAYADETDPNWWQDGSGSYADRGDSTMTLINSGDAIQGDKYLQWSYDSTDPTNQWPETYTEFHKIFPEPLDITVYDKFSVMVRRSFGNSEENIFYFKLYAGGTTETDIAGYYELHHAYGSTYANPGEWVELQIDLADLMYYYGRGFSDLDDVKGMFFGCVGNESQGEGTGTIDIDNIRFMDTQPSCLVAPAADFNNDCKVDLSDFAILAKNWLTTP